MAGAQCDIIIPVYKRLDLIGECFNSIYSKTSGPFNLIVVDNASEPEMKDFLVRFKMSKANVKLIRNETNIGWVKAVNQGMRMSSAPYICMMNNDIIVRTVNWLSGMIEIANMASDIGLVNPSFDIKKGMAKAAKPFIEIGFCRGYCMLVKRSVVEKIGWLDEAYGIGYYDDDDYSVRAIRAGFRCVKANDIFVEHMRDATFQRIFNEENRLSLHEENKQLFYSKWGRPLRLAFVLTRLEDKKKVSEFLLWLARRQHFIYLWNLVSSLNIEHANITEKVVPSAFFRAIFLTTMFINTSTERRRQYDLVFTDDIKKCPASQEYEIYEMSPEKDRIKIEEIVNDTSKR